ncbi:MAG: PfkB family carbohydrate kinase [Pseudomonadota bacterium]
MTRKPSLTDVARKAGVSLGTASNVMNAPDRVRPETRQRVIRAMRDLGYGPKGFVYPAGTPPSRKPPPDRGQRPFLLTIGYISVDFIARMDVMPHRSDRVTCERISKHLGGPAANVAVAAASLGPPFALDVELATAIGHDGDSRWALEQLSERGVRARAVQTPSRERLSRCIVLVEDDGSRTKINEPLTITGDELLPRLPRAPAGRPCHLHADGYQVASLIGLLPRMRALGWTVSAHDTGLAAHYRSAEGFATLTATLSTTFISRGTARALLGCRLATEHLVRAMADYLGGFDQRGEVVMTLGPDGAAVFPGSTAPVEPVRVPAPAVRVVDGTGAGDCFVGVYLAQRLHSVSPESAATTASRAASLSTTTIGAQGGAITAKDLQVDPAELELAE